MSAAAIITRRHAEACRTAALACDVAVSARAAAVLADLAAAPQGDAAACVAGCRTWTIARGDGGITLLMGSAAMAELVGADLVDVTAQPGRLVATLTPLGRIVAMRFELGPALGHREV